MDSICLSDREELLCENGVFYQTLWFSEPGERLERGRPRVQPERLILTCHCEPGPAGSVGSCGGGLTRGRKRAYRLRVSLCPRLPREEQPGRTLRLAFPPLHTALPGLCCSAEPLVPRPVPYFAAYPFSHQPSLVFPRAVALTT